MNRLQKKCLIATAGFHLLLIVILIVGPGFFTSKPKPDDTPLLDVIPANAIEAALNSGVQSAQPPPPTPIVTPPQPVQPPTPIVTPPPAPQPVTPAPSLMERVKEIFKPTPDPTPVDPTPDDSAKPADHKPVKPKPVKPKHDIKVDLTTVVTRPAQTDSAAKQAQAESKREAQHEAQAQAHAYQVALRNLKNGFSSATEIDMPGNSSASYANYGAIVVSIYHHAWISPDNMANDTAVVRFSVTIARDGRVISAHIVTSSGDVNVDNAVKRMLDRVSYIHEFPEGTKDKERNYNIDFNATRTSIL